MKTAYPESYPAHTDVERLRWVHRALAPYFFPRIPRRARGPVLEIGAGTGLYVDYLRRRFPDIQALEMDERAVAAARAAGRPLSRGDWESCEPGDASVGVLIMNQVIEHLVAPPDEVFRKAFRILAPGGFWVIRTPNAASWGRTWFGEYWHPLEVPRHTVIYSDRGLLSLARRTGFEVHGFRYVGRHYDVRQSAGYVAGARGGGGLMCRLARVAVVARVVASVANLCRRGDHMEVVLRKPSTGGA